MNAPTPDDAFAEVFARSIREGLAAPRKRIDSKWLYDAEGSRLFDRITELEAYYPTGRETAILRAGTEAIAATLPPAVTLVEIGSGSSEKTTILLDGIGAIRRYVPLDIAAGHLDAAAGRIRAAYPALEVLPVIGDFTEALSLPPGGPAPVVFFPGSTIGNLERDAARALLARFRAVEGVTGAVVGVDLVKDADVLRRAYDDPEGVTAAFNLNLLERLRRELGADVPVEAFRHEARWDAERARIEMHLVATRDVAFEVAGITVSLAAGETIHTENSHKYTEAGFSALAAEAGWSGARMLTDADGWFGVFLLTP